MEKELMNNNEPVENKIATDEQLIDYHKNKIKELEDEINKLCDDESRKESIDYVGQCYQFGETYRKILAVKVVNSKKMRISYQAVLRASMANNEIESYISSTLVERGKKIESWFGEPISHQRFMEVISDYCEDLITRLDLDKENLQKRFYPTCP